MGMSTIILSFRLVRTYRVLYLSNYLYFIITYNILGFLKLMLTYLAPKLFDGLSMETLQNIHILLLFFVYPLVAIAIYFFIKFITGFLDMDIPGLFKKAYILFWILMCLGYAVGIKFLLEANNPKLISIIYLISLMAILIILSLTFIRLLFFTGKLADKDKQKAAKIFGFIYLLCFMVYMITLIYFSDPYSGTFFEHFLLFSLNLPPLFYLRWFLKKYYLDHPLPLDKEPNWESIFSKYKISNREGEIMRLLFLGKSNKDIEDELFISIKTVKNHIFHIYKKLKVKNRVQLVNLVHNFPEKK
jgi:DNA-binding CsgD family transcriptional regulator